MSVVTLGAAQASAGDLGFTSEMSLTIGMYNHPHHQPVHGNALGADR